MSNKDVRDFEMAFAGLRDSTVNSNGKTVVILKEHADNILIMLMAMRAFAQSSEKIRLLYQEWRDKGE